MGTGDKARLQREHDEARSESERVSLKLSMYLEVGFDSCWFPSFEVLTPRTTRRSESLARRAFDSLSAGKGPASLAAEGAHHIVGEGSSQISEERALTPFQAERSEPAGQSVFIQQRKRYRTPVQRRHLGTLSTLVDSYPVRGKAPGWRRRRSVEDLAHGTTKVLAQAALEDVNATNANHVDAIVSCYCCCC